MTSRRRLRIPGEPMTMVGESFEPDCLTCQAHQGLISLTNAPRILETAHCRVEHACPTSIKGWLVIALARHAEALHQLTEEEFATLARLLRLLSGAPADVLGSEKEYLMQFAEAPGHYHVHFHLVARSSDWPEDLKGSYVMKASGTTVENPLDSDEVTELAWTIREHMLEVADQI